MADTWCGDTAGHGPHTHDNDPALWCPGRLTCMVRGQHHEPVCVRNPAQPVCAQCPVQPAQRHQERPADPGEGADTSSTAQDGTDDVGWDRDAIAHAVVTLTSAGDADLGAQVVKLLAERDALNERRTAHACDQGAMVAQARRQARPHQQGGHVTRVEVHRGDDQIIIDADVPLTEAVTTIRQLLADLPQQQRTGPAGFAQVERSEPAYEARPHVDLGRTR